MAKSWQMLGHFEFTEEGMAEIGRLPGGFDGYSAVTLLPSYGSETGTSVTKEGVVPFSRT